MVRRRSPPPDRVIAAARPALACIVCLVVIGLAAAGCGTVRSDASTMSTPHWSDAAALTIVTLLDHEQGLVALGRQGEAMALDPTIGTEGRELAQRASERAVALDRVLHDAGYDVPERIRLRAIEAERTTGAPVAMTCGVSRGDALGLLAQRPPEEFDEAFRTLVAQQAIVEAALVEAAAGIEPASSALQALA